MRHLDKARFVHGHHEGAPDGGAVLLTRAAAGVEDHLQRRDHGHTAWVAGLVRTAGRVGDRRLRRQAAAGRVMQQPVARTVQLDTDRATGGHGHLLRIAHGGQGLLEIDPLVEDITGKETRPRHGGKDADDDHHQDELDQGETALCVHKA